jgi:hypothetical protein
LSENESGSIPQTLLQIVESRLMVVMINLSDTDDPYLIFESLNIKGSPLEQANLRGFEVATAFVANGRDRQQIGSRAGRKRPSQQPAAVGRRHRHDRADSKKALVAGIRMRRLGEHEDIAKVVRVFASNDSGA